MLHVYHYLTNIINQTVLPLYKKKPEEMISFAFTYRLLLVFI